MDRRGFLVVFLHFVAYTPLARMSSSVFRPRGKPAKHPFTTDWGHSVANLSTKVHRMVEAKRPPDEQRLMDWYEDALDLENACRNWEKAAELRRSKIRRAAKQAA